MNFACYPPPAFFRARRMTRSNKLQQIQSKSSKTLKAVWALLLFFRASLPNAAEILAGRVVGIHDGDTVTLLMVGNQQVKIRLPQMDAPEIDHLSCALSGGLTRHIIQAISINPATGLHTKKRSGRNQSNKVSTIVRKHSIRKIKTFKTIFQGKN